MKTYKMKKPLLLLAAFCMLFTSVVTVLPSGSAEVKAAIKSDSYHDYQYSVAGSNATITQYTKANVSTPEVLFVPAEITYAEAEDGDVTYTTVNVTTIGNGGSSAFTNSKNTQYVFLPKGITTMSPSAVYDYNEVVGWSFPDTLTTIADNAFLSSFTVTKNIYAPGSMPALEQIAKDNGAAFDTSVNTVTVQGANDLENGTIYPAGTYYIPKNIDAGYKATFTAVANAGYKVDAVTVAGKKVSVSDKGDFEITLADLSDGATISATFTEDASFDMDSYVAELEAAAEEEDVDNPADITMVEGKDIEAVDGGIYDFTNSTGGKLIVSSDISIKLRNLTIGSKAAETGSGSGGGMAPPGMEGSDGGEGGGGPAPDAPTAGQMESGDASGDAEPQIYDSLNDLFVVKNGPVTIVYDTFKTTLYENAIDGEGEGTAPNGTFKLSDGSILTALEDMESDSRYNVTIGPAGGVYYARSSMFYEMTGNLNTAKILAGETAEGDYIYDYIGMYSDQGPYYGYYAYSNFAIADQTLDLKDKMITIGENPNAEIGDEDCVTNTSAILARFGAKVTVNDLNVVSYSRYDGPTEGANFWGTNSAILADSYAEITANDAVTDGQANAVYATEFSTIYLNGGDFNANYSGSHGLYVGYGGTIYANLDREKDDSNREILTKITTVDEASTTLATDTGGGVIEVSNVEATAYGLRSAGVYSIGHTDGDVRVYNSIITSYLDGGFTSASGGLISADNSIIQGVYALKARSGGGADASVKVKNSKLVSLVDMDALESVGYKTDFTQYDGIDWANEVESPDFNGFNLTNGGLNFFLDKMNKEVNYASQYYWYGDGNGGSATYTKYAEDGTANTVTYEPYANAPGHSGGGKLGLIFFTESSSYPMEVTASYLYNDNYEKHKDEAPDLRNYLIVSDGGSTANVVFTDENSSTKWDKTGEYDETCELVGDLYAGKDEASAVMAAGGVTASYNFVSSKVNMTLNNSEWTGTTVGNVEGVAVTMDGSSTWYVPETTTIGSLTLADGAVITGADGAVITSVEVAETDASGDVLSTSVMNLEDVKAGTYNNITFVVNGEAVSADAGPAPAADDSAAPAEAGNGSVTKLVTVIVVAICGVLAALLILKKKK